MKNQSILYSPFIMGSIIAFTPIFVISYFAAIYNHHIEVDFYHLPMIQNIMIQLPESRLYSVGMNLLAWWTLPVFLIMDRILKLKCKIEKCNKDRLIYCIRWLMNIFAGFSFFGMLGMASINNKEHSQFHQISVFVVVIFLTLYYILFDLEMCWAKLNVSIINRIWSFLGIIAYLSSYFLFKYQNSELMKSVAALFQYISIPCFSLKFYDSQHEIYIVHMEYITTKRNSYYT